MLKKNDKTGSKLRPDLVTMGIGVSACGKGGKWPSCLHFLDLTKGQRVVPSMTLLNSVLDGLDRGGSGCWRRSLEILGLLHQERIDLDSLSIRSLMKASEANSNYVQIPAFIQRAEAWIEASTGHIRLTRNEKPNFEDEGFIMESFESIVDQTEVQEKVSLQQSNAWFEREPAAKNLVAWSAGALNSACLQRQHGRSDPDEGHGVDRQMKLEAIEEGYPANVPLVLNVNLNVTGFKIFGEFSGAYVTGTVLSPLAQNVVGIWFNLKSPLKASLETGQTSQMRLWLPPTFQPLPDCGTALNLFSLSYDVGRELVKNPFPTTISYLSLPSGTYCFDGYDEASGQWYVEMTIEQEVSYGLDYAFEFALTNPFRTPATSDNVWRFETLQNGVILHLRRSVPGFELEQIKEVRVTPSDTTTLLALHRLEFYIMSDKYIPGGSKIEITAPNGFIFTCAFFSTDDGLANTTTCYVRELNIAEFTMDTSDPLQPNSPFRLFVFVSNPEFTPQQNYWNFRIISPLAKTLDMRDYVQSFDITGRLEVDIQATFPYFGQINPLRIVFTQSTILNQADIGNELVLDLAAFSCEASCL
ncbi:Pentatricopeptide repeat-containing protein [Durusdinium trenchii]|uniref:Chloroplastic n=1 Tax=Durusdinium trenchii TaxID=1381693 RepID=A0ABP0KRF2_9DINO